LHPRPTDALLVGFLDFLIFLIFVFFVIFVLLLSGSASVEVV
jgi:hypothetical protein